MPKQLYVRAPDGSIGVIPPEQEQDALNAGYTAVTPEEAEAAVDHFRRGAGDQAAVSAGVLEAPADYSVGRAFGEKALSAATFGLAPGLDTASARARGARFAEERPWAALGAEALGQLPGAIVTGAVGAAAVGAAAGGGLAARAAAAGVDWSLNAAVGGVATEAEETRLSGEDFSWTDAAVSGLAGEAIGRGAAAGFSKTIGASRHLWKKATTKAVATDASSSLAKGGLLNDARVAYHSKEYQAELSRLAADDLDGLETSFAEVSRQDRKRARILKTVEDRPEAQAAIRQEAEAGLSTLYDALSSELADAPGPAKQLLRQLDDRLDALASATSGRKLWRLLDENRQALQEFSKDIHASYEAAPGSAWLSRDGLAALDAAEEATRTALLREDAWGTAAAKAQADYNTPFHEKYFPNSKTVRGRLMVNTATDARGAPVFRGDPGKVKALFSREANDVDGARLREQFSDYLDGVEAIARTGADDTPAAARATLEHVRRLRKALANAELVSAASQRAADRAGKLGFAVDATAGAIGTAASGPFGGAAVMAGVRGARAGDFLVRAAMKLGWVTGQAEDMAALLGKDALAPAAGRDAPLPDLDDLVGGGTPPPRPSSGPPSAPPTGGGPGAPPAGPASPAGGLTPSMRAAAADPNWVPSEAPGVGVSSGVRGATAAESLGPVDSAAADVAATDLARPGRAARAERPTLPVDGRFPATATIEADDALRPGYLARQRDAERVKALTEGEFRDVVRQVRAVGTDEARSFADKLVADLEALKMAGLVVAGAGAAAGAAALAADGENKGFVGAAAGGLALFLPKVLLKNPWVKNLADGFPDAAMVKGSLPEILGQIDGAVDEGVLTVGQGMQIADYLDDVVAATDAGANRTGDDLSALFSGPPAKEPVDLRRQVAQQLGASEWLFRDGSTWLDKKVGDAQGSNDGGWYQSKHGGKRYIKFYDQPEQALTEAAANKLYGEKLAPKTELFVAPDGRVGHAAEDLNSVLGTAWRHLSVDEVTPEQAKAFVKGFWHDVWLANWDVVGLTGDNLMWRDATTLDGAAVRRIDNGSSFKYRAQGAEKPASALAALTEIEGFFNPKLNPNYAALLRRAGVQTPYDLVQELNALVRRYEQPGQIASALNDFTPELRNLAETRFELLKEYAKKLEPERLQRLRENLGASRKLGAGFKGTDNDAFEVVEAAKGEGDGGGAAALPPPPDLPPAVEYSSDFASHPGLNRLIQASRRKVDDLTREQREALTAWVDSSRAIRAVSAGGLDAAAEKVGPYGPTANAEKSLASAKAFNEAMEHLTVLNPTQHGPLFRHIDLSDRALAELLQKDEFVASAPASLGYIPDANFGPTQLRFKKVDSAGALIGLNPAESEMILLPDTHYRKTGQYYDPATDGFVFEFEEVPVTSKTPAWGDLGHLSLGPLALAAGAAADPAGAVEDDSPNAPAAGAAATPAAAAFGATAAVLKQGRAKLVRSVAKRLFAGVAEPALRTTARLAYSREQLAQRREEFSQWQADPNALVERVAEGLRDAPPSAFSKAATGVFAAASFLREKLPQSAKPNPVALRGAPVSAEAAAKYARYEQAALDPGEALREAAEASYLSPELLETLQALYPDLLAEVRVEAYQAVRAGGPPLGIQAKTQYARLFDGDGAVADPAFSASAVRMVSYAYEQQGAPKPAPAPSPQVSQMAAAVAAPAPFRTS
jgi:hypothetical protein